MSDTLIVRRHDQSRRTAIIADEGDSAWLYLTESDTEAISADCWLFNRVAVPSLAILEGQFPAYRLQALPPPAPADVIAADSVRDGDLRAIDLQVRWSRDGHGVAAWESGQLIAFISPDSRHGFSRYLLLEGPWGAPLDLQRYERWFSAERGEA